jgi:Flp pilus assembly protein TadG
MSECRHADQHRHRLDRGHSVSAFTAVVAVALFLVCGLVVDGGGQLTATARAEHTAATAVRLAVDAAAGSSGVDRIAAARSAAESYLGSVADATGSVTVTAREVSVDVQTEQATLFLGLIGLRVLRASATARGDLHYR